MRKFIELLKFDFKSNNNINFVVLNFFNIIILNLILAFIFNDIKISEQKIFEVVIWLSLIFSNLLILEKIFIPDYEDGVIDLYNSYGFSNLQLFFIKSLNQLIVIIAPIILYIALMGCLNEGLQLQLPLIAIVLCSILFSFISTLTALIFATMKNSLLAFTIYIPLIVPFLILGILLTNGKIFVIKIILGLILLFIGIVNFIFKFFE